VFVLLFIILNLTSTNGQDCEPCRCEAETMDCTKADYISSDLFYVMISYEKVVMPTHLIDRNVAYRDRVLLCSFVVSIVYLPYCSCVHS
jgi:hypothetical protein